jgi:hypothetical protein
MPVLAFAAVDAGHLSLIAQLDAVTKLIPTAVKATS